MKFILVTVVVFLIIITLYLVLDKKRFCREYTLNSYNYGMLSDNPGFSKLTLEEMYDYEYQKCSDKYLLRRFDDLNNRF